MIPDHAALTEKEKQALRLLTSGYDAKSMAVYLGLSVHTVNERLRDARRKLATSSSREAARLLRELEGPAPEKVMDKDLRDASAAHVAADPASQPDNRAVRSSAGWNNGAIAMSFLLISFALVALAARDAAIPTAPPVAITETAPVVAATETAPVVAARQFLMLVDADDWAASWELTGQSFKMLNTVQGWTHASTRVRAVLGPFKHREHTSAEYVPAPPKGYWMVKFHAGYANQPNAIETVTLMKESDGWHVVGVTID